MKSYTVTANGIRQFVVEEGEGAPVILLHGFPETNYAWRYQIPVLSRHYRVIAPDLRGYGETDKPASGYDKRNMARDIRELMRYSCFYVFRVKLYFSIFRIQAIHRN
ncbi:alpha/beta fold hydrolase [Enterobacter asburiae]|uniref:alpha/beta fold hydrolase n=1 Tax=Enterobacter asburiae TaxID=61645 RepID=UPI0031FF1FB4